MSRNASELCVQLVDDIYGELTSRIFKILLRYGRLSIPALHYHTGLSPRLIKHGLSVLVQQQLVVWYTYAEEPTVYEANTEAAYFLIRSGKYVKIAEDQIDEFAGAVISNLLLLGHAKVGDLVKAYGVSSRKDVNGPTTATHGVANKPLANDVINAKDHVGDNAVTLETIHNTLRDLLRLGLVSHVNESHFRSDADNRLEAQKVVPPPEYYKAKSKKENEAQWEASIQNKLEEWMFGTEAEIEDVEILRKGGKRLLEDPESSRAGKRQRLHSDRSNEIISATGTDYKSKTVDKGFLDKNLVLRVNYVKFAVIMRNNSLVKLAEQSICTSTSKIYARALRELEMETRACRDEFNDAEIFDDDPDMSSLPQVSTGFLVDAINDSVEFASSLAKVDASRVGPKKVDHPKKRRKKIKNDSEDEVMIDGDASSDEDEGDSDSGDSVTSISHDSEEANCNADYNPNAAPLDIPKDSHPQTIRNHLLLLARHPHGFLEHFPETPNMPERWTVLYRPLIKRLTHHTILETITARYGHPAARITRLLSEKGKVDEKNLQSLSLMNQKTMRSYLTALHTPGMIQLQEVPRDNSRNPQRTMFLWYLDIERCKAKLLQETYKSMARCLQRARVEGDRVKGTVEKATRSDVVGREEELLAPQELEALKKWREMEEKIWGEVGRLDDLVAVIRDF